MSKVDDFKNSKRQASEVRVVRADAGGKPGMAPGFITHTTYMQPPTGNDKGKPITNMEYEKPEIRTHSSINSVHAHMKDCMSTV